MMQVTPTDVDRPHCVGRRRYARGFIVALGRDFYEAVVRNPEMAVLDADCEEMCYFFAHLYDERFGDYPDTGSGISRESCSNPAGWPDWVADKAASDAPTDAG